MFGKTTASLFTVLLTSCSTPLPAGRVVPGYDDFSRRLLQLSADQDGDGRFDQWTYMEGNRPLRGEADVDADGRIDRWEYFDASGNVFTIGSASRNDGVEDTWTSTAATPTGETHIASSARRDRVRDRHAYYNGETLVRVEEDTNGDGVIDKWDRYEGAVLREVGFDVSFSRGRPDRRALYDAQGKFAAVEVDPDGDGRFVAAPADAQKPRSSGVTR